MERKNILTYFANENGASDFVDGCMDKLGCHRIGRIALSTNGWKELDGMWEDKGAYEVHTMDEVYHMHHCFHLANVVVVWLNQHIFSLQISRVDTFLRGI